MEVLAEQLSNDGKEDQHLPSGRKSSEFDSIKQSIQTASGLRAPSHSTRSEEQPGASIPYLLSKLQREAPTDSQSILAGELNESKTSPKSGPTSPNVLSQMLAYRTSLPSYYLILPQKKNRLVSTKSCFNKSIYPSL